MATGAVEEFEAQRVRMFGLAYRLLGSAAEAEDVVQDAFLRWHQAIHEEIRDEAAWLAKVVTNLSLNRLASVRVQRERYVGPWLPEPVVTSDGALGPLDSAELRDSVSMALLVLLEKLSPTERAVFVLREAFGYSHREIAQFLDTTEANSRQMLHRAQARLGAETKSEVTPTDPAHWQELVYRFLVAARDGDLAGLEAMLAQDAISWADGGGKINAARRPVLGRERVARYLAGVLEKFGAGVIPSFAEVNGQQAVLAHSAGSLQAVWLPQIAHGRVTALLMIVNPNKLVFASAQLEALSHSSALPGS